MEATDGVAIESARENGTQKGEIEEKKNDSTLMSESTSEQNKVSTKSYDATKASKEERERREQKHLAAVQRKEEKEMKACTFKPEISRRSMEIANSKPRQSVVSPV